MRYRGQGHEIVVELPNRDYVEGDGSTLQTAFDKAYSAVFGRVIPRLSVEVLTWSLSLSTGSASGSAQTAVQPDTRPVEASSRRQVFDAGTAAFMESACYDRATLHAGAVVSGPALIVEAETTTVVSASFNATVDPAGHIVLRAKESR